MLIAATHAQQIERDRLTYDAWGQALTMEGFLDREQRLRAHPWAREAMTTWLLTAEDGSILSSCETFKMASYARASADVAMQEASSYAVASVYTESALRGRGHAVQMMSLVVERVRELDPSAHALVLYSDVGARIYERAGYAPLPALARVFEPERGDAGQSASLIAESSMARALSLVPLPPSDFLIWPTAPQIDWHLERERAYSSLLGRQRPAACGARAGSSIALWVASFKSDELWVLLLHAESPSDLSALLTSARRTAGAAGLQRVVCWDQPLATEWPSGDEGGALGDRDGSIPMICPINPSISPSSWRVIPKALWV